ncbi:Hypothetical protein NTJ_02707 [Nesidiocoris tenuis]|uniref:Uncharacterized protein n=1 Tax=Nesidiocoris tenuis TaxID=355587 RepID=A0ABN7ACA8_9HEMI|nr:Hypothetical protein NTJ_02707 [Nesidiocoris tenuis]
MLHDPPPPPTRCGTPRIVRNLLKRDKRPGTGSLILGRSVGLWTGATSRWLAFDWAEQSGELASRFSPNHLHVPPGLHHCSKRALANKVDPA